MFELYFLHRFKVLLKKVLNRISAETLQCPRCVLADVLKFTDRLLTYGVTVKLKCVCGLWLHLRGVDLTPIISCVTVTRNAEHFTVKVLKVLFGRRSQWETLKFQHSIFLLCINLIFIFSLCSAIVSDPRLEKAPVHLFRYSFEMLKQ